eukprot:scaffold48858_cov55-Attheya_sp.AAC.3
MGPCAKGLSCHNNALGAFRATTATITQSNATTQTAEHPEKEEEEGIEAAPVSVLFRDLSIDAQSNAEDLQLIAKQKNVNESALQTNIMSKIHELENNNSKRELEIEKLKLNLEQYGRFDFNRR